MQIVVNILRTFGCIVNKSNTFVVSNVRSSSIMSFWDGDTLFGCGRWWGVIPGDKGDGGNAGDIKGWFWRGKLGEWLAGSEMGGEGRAWRRADMLEIPDNAGEAGWRDVPGTSTVTRRKMASIRRNADSSASKSGFPRSDESKRRYCVSNSIVAKG